MCSDSVLFLSTLSSLLILVAARRRDADADLLLSQRLLVVSMVSDSLRLWLSGCSWLHILDGRARTLEQTGRRAIYARAALVHVRNLLFIADAWFRCLFGSIVGCCYLWRKCHPNSAK